MIMAACQDGAAERVVGGDIDTALIGKDAGFNLPISKPGAKGEGNVFVHRLESL